MIDINSIIHLENEVFDIEKDIALLCIKNYQKETNSFQFKENEVYSIAFANKQGAMINNFTLKCTKQKHHFKIIEIKDIEIPHLTLQDLLETNNFNEIIETKYRFEKSGYKQVDSSAFRKNSIYNESEIKDAGLDINTLLQEGAITWLKW